MYTLCYYSLILPPYKPDTDIQEEEEEQLVQVRLQVDASEC